MASSTEPDLIDRLLEIADEFLEQVTPVLKPQLQARRAEISGHNIDVSSDPDPGYQEVVVDSGKMSLDALATGLTSRVSVEDRTADSSIRDNQEVVELESPQIGAGSGTVREDDFTIDGLPSSPDGLHDTTPEDHAADPQASPAHINDGLGGLEIDSEDGSKSGQECFDADDGLVHMERNDWDPDEDPVEDYPDEHGLLESDYSVSTSSQEHRDEVGLGGLSPSWQDSLQGEPNSNVGPRSSGDIDTDNESEIASSDIDTRPADPWLHDIDELPGDEVVEEYLPETINASAGRSYDDNDCPFCFESQDSDYIEAECGHRICRPCINSYFNLCADNEPIYPPKCCDIVIHLEDVEHMLEGGLARYFMEKVAEFETPDRLYCALPSCAMFIIPENCQLDLAFCWICETITCRSCGSIQHEGQCRYDAQTEQVLELARENGWQRCYRCRHVIAMTEGCNHMVCSCEAEFCYLCALPWKRCDCPMANNGGNYEDEGYRDWYEGDWEEQQGDWAENDEQWQENGEHWEGEENTEQQGGGWEQQEQDWDHVGVTERHPSPDYVEPPEPPPAIATQAQKDCSHVFLHWLHRRRCARCQWFTDWFHQSCQRCRVNLCSLCMLAVNRDPTDWPEIEHSNSKPNPEPSLDPDLDSPGEGPSNQANDDSNQAEALDDDNNHTSTEEPNHNSNHNSTSATKEENYPEW